MGVGAGSPGVLFIINYLVLVQNLQQISVKEEKTILQIS